MKFWLKCMMPFRKLIHLSAKIEKTQAVMARQNMITNDVNKSSESFTLRKSYQNDNKRTKLRHLCWTKCATLCLSLSAWIFLKYYSLVTQGCALPQNNGQFQNRDSEFRWRYNCSIGNILWTHNSLQTCTVLISFENGSSLWNITHLVPQVNLKMKVHRSMLRWKLHIVIKPRYHFGF